MHSRCAPHYARPCRDRASTTPSLPPALSPTTAGTALQGVRWAALLPPTFPRPIPAHRLLVRRSAICLPDRLPFGCSILVGADLYLDGEAHSGNVGAVRRSLIGCLGQLAGVSKVVRHPTPRNASDGFCSFTTEKIESIKSGARMGKLVSDPAPPALRWLSLWPSGSGNEARIQPGRTESGL